MPQQTEWHRVQSATDYLAALQRQAARPQYWDWEATLERSYCRLLRPGATALDIGAHSGRHVAGLRQRAGCRHIVAVEPQPVQAQQLQQRYAGVAGVEVRVQALGRSAGRADFVVNAAAPEESGLRRRHYNDEAGAMVETIAVQVGTLDELLAETRLDALDFIKIDVEGAELDVLEGGSETLRRWRPLIAIEYGSPSFSVYGRKPGDLFDQAGAMDYVITDLLGHPCTNRDAWLTLVDAYYWDFLLVPRERLVQVNTALAADRWPLPVSAGRPPDRPGHSLSLFWQGLLARLRPAQAKSARIDHLVATAYRELLDREPDPEGLRHYREQLQRGTLDARGMRQQLRTSPEHAARKDRDTGA